MHLKQKLMTRNKIISEYPLYISPGSSKNPGVLFTEKPGIFNGKTESLIQLQ